MIKRIITIFAVMLFSALSLGAQQKMSSVSQLLASLPSEGCICAEYELTVSSEKIAEIKYIGKLWWQDGMFRIEGSGYSIYSNGIHTWTIDSVAREAIREEVLPLDSIIPAADGADGSAFLVKKSAEGTRVISVSMRMKNGSSVSISVPSMTYGQEEPLGFFTFDESQLPKDYVFTALD